MQRVDPQAQRKRGEGDDDALHHDQRHVHQRPAEQQPDPADRGDPAAFDDAGPDRLQQAVAGEQTAEQAHRHQQAGHVDPVRVGVAAGALAGQRGLEERGEQHQVADRLGQAERDHGLAAHHQAGLLLVDQPGVTEKLHRCPLSVLVLLGFSTADVRRSGSVLERAAGLGQEHVVQAGPAGLHRARLDAACPAGCASGAGWRSRCCRRRAGWCRRSPRCC